MAAALYWPVYERGCSVQLGEYTVVFASRQVHWLGLPEIGSQVPYFATRFELDSTFLRCSSVGSVSAVVLRLYLLYLLHGLPVSCSTAAAAVVRTVDGCPSILR